MSKKLARILAVSFLSILTILFVTKMVLDKPLPKADYSEAADSLANKMLEAINHNAWLKTAAVAWSFKDMHSFVWDKNRHLAEVKWGENRVVLNLNTQKGEAFVNGKRVEDAEEENKLVQQAYSFWANDSFWFNPVSKIFDDGTSRGIVTTDDGQKALLVSYSSGGVTPGDAYMWYLDENYLPTKWQMWVSIIPIDGVEATWEQWKSFGNGVMISTLHHTPIFDIEIKNIKLADDLMELTDGVDIFSSITE